MPVTELSPPTARLHVHGEGLAARIAAGATEEPLVVVVDDHQGVREALDDLLQSVGIDSVSFASPREMMAVRLPDRPGCMILDVRMPGISGLDLQRQLAAGDDAKPVIFLTGHGDVAMAVEAMKAGAIDFLMKPVRDQTLLDAVNAGIARDVARRETSKVVRRQLDLLATLTPRERQVLAEMTRGQLNKQIAFTLGISEVTVKLHRANVMRKMQARSIGDLIRSWEMLLPHLPKEALAA